MRNKQKNKGIADIWCCCACAWGRYKYSMCSYLISPGKYLTFCQAHPIFFSSISYYKWKFFSIFKKIQYQNEYLEHQFKMYHASCSGQFFRKFVVLMLVAQLQVHSRAYKTSRHSFEIKRNKEMLVSIYLKV